MAKNLFLSYFVEVKDAIANKLVGYPSVVRMKPESGELTLADSKSDLLLPLLRIPEMVDWLSDVELAMAREAKPSESMDGILDQITSLQVKYCCWSLYLETTYLVTLSLSRTSRRWWPVRKLR